MIETEDDITFSDIEIDMIRLDTIYPCFCVRE